MCLIIIHKNWPSACRTTHNEGSAVDNKNLHIPKTNPPIIAVKIKLTNLHLQLKNMFSDTFCLGKYVIQVHFISWLTRKLVKPT